jgi:hypothetical protein
MNTSSFYRKQSTNPEAKTTIPWRTVRSIFKVIVMLFGPDKLVLRLQNWNIEVLIYLNRPGIKPTCNGVQ